MNRAMRSLVFAFLPLIIFTGIAISKLIFQESTPTVYKCQSENGIMLEAHPDQITVKLPNGEQIAYDKITQKSDENFCYYEGINGTADTKTIEFSIRKSLDGTHYEFTAVLGSEAYSGSAEAQKEGV